MLFVYVNVIVWIWYCKSYGIYGDVIAEWGNYDDLDSIDDIIFEVSYAGLVWKYIRGSSVGI